MVEVAEAENHEELLLCHAPLELQKNTERLLSQFTN